MAPRGACLRCAGLAPVGGGESGEGRPSSSSSPPLAVPLGPWRPRRSGDQGPSVSDSAAGAAEWVPLPVATRERGIKFHSPITSSTNQTKGPEPPSVALAGRRSRLRLRCPVAQASAVRRWPQSTMASRRAWWVVCSCPCRIVGQTFLVQGVKARRTLRDRHRLRFHYITMI